MINGMIYATEHMFAPIHVRGQNPVVMQWFKTRPAVCINEAFIQTKSKGSGIHYISCIVWAKLSNCSEERHCNPIRLSKGCAKEFPSPDPTELRSSGDLKRAYPRSDGEVMRNKYTDADPQP